MEIFKKILHSYAMYRRKEIVQIFKSYLIPKKSYGTLSKGAIFFLSNPVHQLYNIASCATILICCICQMQQDYQSVLHSCKPKERNCCRRRSIDTVK